VPNASDRAASKSVSEPEDPQDSEGLSREVLALVAQITHQFESQQHEGWQWIVAQSPNAQVADVLQDSTSTMLRVLDAIGRLEPVNGITIASQFAIPKGTVSKVTRRLVAKKLVITESLPNNRKEVLFRLTPLGRDVYTFHRAFDERMERGFLQFLQRYDASELRILVRVLRDAAHASFLTP
jgi:DNA-binding MarR family transcriptional regulator